jgi:hypothetical protein
MRRKINSNKFIFLIISIAVFTISSYFFDQMVIRKEDDLRNLKIKLENSNLKINNVNNIINQLTTIQQYANLKYLNLGKFRNYWFKNLIILTDESVFKKERESILDNFVSKDFAVTIVKSRFLDFFITVVDEHNSIMNRIDAIYEWPLEEFLPERYDIDGKMDYPEVDYLKTFYEIENLNTKNFEKYAQIKLDDDKYENALNYFTIDDWEDIHKYTYNLINKFDFYYDFINDDSKKLEIFLSKQEKNRNSVITKISKINSQKNYFILTSIISQIISLLFLLFLFRSLLLNKSIV